MIHRPDTMSFAMPAARLWLLALVCLCLLACSAAPEPLRVGAIAWPGYEPLFLAEAEGQLATAHFAGLALLRDQPDRAAERIARRWQIPAGDAANRFQGLELTDLAANRQLLGGATPPLAERARELGVWMQHQHLLKEHPPLVQLVSARYLPAD